MRFHEGESRMMNRLKKQEGSLGDPYSEFGTTCYGAQLYNSLIQMFA